MDTLADCNMDMDTLADCNMDTLADCNMDTLFQAAEEEEALTPMLPESAKISGDYMLTSEDQRFLLVFIMGTYFGPDVKAENPKKSALQRIAEGLPAYTSDQLTGSEMKMANAEQVYYYVLGKADEAVLLKQSFLHQFFQGNLKNQEMDDPVGDHRQFPDLFPTHLHPQSYHGGQYKIIENVVFINNPETSYMKQEDIERFKRLSGLEDLMLDRNEATWGGGISSNTDNMKLEDLKGETLLTKSASFPTEMKEESDVYQELEEIAGPAMLLLSSCPTDLKGEPLLNKSASFPTEMKEESDVYQELEEIAGPAMLLLSSCPTDLKGERLLNKSASFPTEMKEESDVYQELEEIAGPAMLLLSSCPTDLKGEPLLTKSTSFPTEMKEESDVYQELEEIAGPAMLLLSSCPTKQQWDNIVASTKKGIQYYGSIAKQPVGPLLGLVDIGECEDAYLFHVSLPGVSRNDFTCEVETDGRVLIKGVTVTGPKYVNRFSQIFEMRTQNHSPPGPFMVSFKLPGPVDPKEFTGNFGEDGILEVIVLKLKS